MNEQLPLEELESIDLEKAAYERRKLSIQRLTFLFFAIDAVLLVFVILELVQWINRLAN
jgi:hypothetical protein